MRSSFGPGETLEASLTKALGPMVGGAQLTRALGYPTQAAFQRALTRGLVPIPVFTIAGRRGRFALTRDLAEWLIAVRYSTDRKNESSTESDS